MTILDVQGMKCPLPVLKTRRAMQALQAGDRLEILATDPGIVNDMQHYCTKSGNRIIQHETRGEVHYYLLEKVDIIAD